MRHEAQHYEIIECGTRQIYNALLDLHADSCDDLEVRANDAIRSISDEHASMNAQLDRDTDHGAAEGAVWPPHNFVMTH